MNLRQPLLGQYAGGSVRAQVAVHASAVRAGGAGWLIRLVRPALPIDEQLGVFSNYKPRIRAAWIGPCSWDVADVPTSAATVLPRVVVDLSRIRRISWKGSASIAVPNAAGNRAASPDLLVRRRKAARSEHGVHVTRLLWLLLRGASGRVDMLMRRLRPRDLVFAAAIAVPLETVPNAVRLASLLMLSGGERAATAVAPLALITVSSCLRPSAIDTLALRPDGHQHEQQPGWNGRGSWRRHDLLRRFGRKKNQTP